MTPELTFQEMLQKIRGFRYPKVAAFVTIWWNIFDEANQMIHLLKTLGYKVTTYKFKGEIEIRFQYTKEVGSLTPNQYLSSLPEGA